MDNYPHVKSWVFQFHGPTSKDPRLFPPPVSKLVMEEFGGIAFEALRTVPCLTTVAVQSGPCGRLITGSSGSKAALAFFAAQYKDCLDTHTKCQRWASGSSFLPARVIDVGSTGDDQVCLRAGESVKVFEPYLTLSHCWGQAQPFTLTKKTAAQLEKGVLVANLPKTFQDAILVTRRLHFRYLWIDSL